MVQVAVPCMPPRVRAAPVPLSQASLAAPSTPIPGLYNIIMLRILLIFATAVISLAPAGTSLGSCPVGSYISAASCLSCPFGKTSTGTGGISTCVPSCLGLCLKELPSLDTRRLALPCDSSNKGSQVFLHKDAVTYPFDLVLESATDSIITSITATANASARLSWGSSALFTVSSSPPNAPFNSSQAALLLSQLLICMNSTNATAVPVTVTISLTVTSAASPPFFYPTSSIPLLLYPPPIMPLWTSPKPPANLSVQPSSLTMPHLTADLTLTSASATVTPWASTSLRTSLAWSSDAHAALSRVLVSIYQGCMPGDALSLPQASSFFGRVLPLPQPRCGSATGWQLQGTGSLHLFLAQLNTLTLQSSAASQLAAPPSLLRVLKFEFEGLATVYTSVQVQPLVISPLNSIASAQLVLPEALPPDFAVVLMQRCPSTSPTGGTVIVHGLPTLCFSSPDALVFRNESVDAYAGALLGPLALQPAARISVGFSGYAGSSGACAWTAEPIGDAVFDCSLAPAPAWGEPTQPLACAWSRYRLVVAQQLPMHAAGSAVCGAGCALDYESACPGSSTLTPPPASYAVNVTLTRADLMAGAVSASASTLLTLIVGNVQEPAALAWRSPTAATLGTPTLLIDDTTGLAAAGAPTMLLCSQDSSAFTVTLSEAAAEGPTVTRPFNISALFAPVPFPPSSPSWLKDWPTCFDALSASSPLGSTSTAPVWSWAYVTPFTLSGESSTSAGDALRHCPARTFGVLVQQASAQPLYMSITLTRANRPVSWASAQPALTLPENAAPSTSTAALSVQDSDSEQDVTFSLLSVTLLACNGLLPTVLPPFQPPQGLFVLEPQFNASTVTDAATGTAAVVPTTREVAIAVGLDSLSNQAAAAACALPVGVPATCVYRLVLQAQDSGNFTPSHSLLPLQPPTRSVRAFELTVEGRGSGIPLVTQILGVPPGGLSAGGGDVLDFNGTSLGLNASSFAAVLGNGEASFPLVSCILLQRLTLVRCTTTPGFGPVTGLWLRVGLASSFFSALNLTLPSYQTPRVLAVLQQPAAGTRAAATPVWHATLPTLGPLPTPAQALPALLDSSPALAYTPPPINITLLVDGAPLSLANLSFTPTVWAVILLDAGSFLPLGVCAPTLPAPQRLDFSALAKSNPVFAPLTLPAPLASAAWYDCPFPPLSAGHFRQLAVHVEFSLPGAAQGLPFKSFFLSDANPLSGQTANLTSSALAPPIQLSMAANSTNLAALPARARPVISAVEQPLPGGAFTIYGSHFGTADLAWHSDLVEYYAGTGCDTAQARASLLVSCAVHTAIGCVYSANHTQITCDLDTAGWGAGFAVRVLVGGQASDWFSGTSPHLSYAPPVLRSLQLASASGLNSTALPVLLEPAGGGMLVLQGSNLYPAAACVITVGGVRVFAVNARPLQQHPPSLPLPDCRRGNATSFGCFGNAEYAWRAQQPSTTSLLVTYPPGVGNVTVSVSLGPFTSSLSVAYAAPLLKAVLASTGSKASNSTFTFFITSARLSPCAHSALPPTFLPGKLTSSSYAASLRAAPFPPEGSLPQPQSSPATSFSLAASCALPDGLWVPRGSAPPSSWTRALAGPASSLLLALVQQGEQQLDISKATISADFGTDTLVVSNATLGEVQLVYKSGIDGAAGLPVASNAFSIDSGSLRSPSPVVNSLSPVQWDTSPSATTAFDMTVANTGPFGAVLVIPSSDSAASVKGTLSSWQGGPIACPITPATQLTLTDAEGNTFNTTAAEQPYEPPVQSDAFSTSPTFLDVWSDVNKPKWVRSTAPLPCWISQWSGADSVNALVLPSQTLTVQQPAWLGTVRVEVFTKGIVSASLRTASYATPQVTSILPDSGSSAGGYGIVISGKNLGLGGSLGSIWHATGAAALRDVIVAGPLPPDSPCSWPVAVPPSAFSHSAMFSYSTPTPDAMLRRMAGITSWSDTLVTCIAPEGVASSINTPVLLLNYATSTAGRADEAPLWGTQRFTYAPPALTSAELMATVALRELSDLPLMNAPPTLPPAAAASPWQVVLRGKNLSRFTATSPASLDISEGGQWTYKIVATALPTQGLVNGSNSLDIPQNPTHVFSNDAIIFPAPFFEGTISLSLQLISARGAMPVFPAPTQALPLTAPAPRILSVAAVSVPAVEDDDDFNPCQDLLDPFQGAEWRASPSRKCIRDIYTFFPPPPLPPGPPPPCFRVTPSSSTTGTGLRVTGVFFGSGKWAYQGILLYSQAAAASVALPPQSGNESMRPISFTAASSLQDCYIDKNRTVWSSTFGGQSSVYCMLNPAVAALPRGPAVLQAGVAFSSANSSSAGVALIGACPCGYYSEANGQACTPCEGSAFCLGALDPPRARAGFWLTVAQEWEARGLTGEVPGALALPPTPRWVPCATPSECLPNNTCALGAAPSFMCTECLSIPGGVVYARGSSGACELCSRTDSLALVLGIALGLPLLLATYFASQWCCARLECCHSLQRRGKAAVASAGSLIACCRCFFPRPTKTPLSAATLGAEGKEAAVLKPDPQPILALLRIGITFLQTLGALSLYTSSSHIRGRPADPQDALIIPKLLKSLAFFLDFGLSMSQFSCAASITYTQKLYLIIALPWAVIVLAPPALHFGSAALGGARAWLHTCASRALRLPRDAASLAPLRVSVPLLTVSLLFLLLPTVISSLARSQDCADADVGGYLYADPSVSCPLPAISLLTGRARLAAYFYAILFPVFIACWCVGSFPGFAIFDSLTTGYHSMTFTAKYWEIFALVRKSVVLGFATRLLYLQDPRSQVLATTQFLAFSLAFHLSVWPFGSKRTFNTTLNWLDTLSLAGSIAFSLAITARVQSILGMDLPLPVIEQNALDFMALLLCLPFVCAWIFLFVDAVAFEGYAASRVSAAASALWLSLRPKKQAKSLGSLHATPRVQARTPAPAAASRRSLLSDREGSRRAGWKGVSTRGFNSSSSSITTTIRSSSSLLGAGSGADLLSQRRLLATQRLHVLESASSLISVRSISEPPFGGAGSGADLLSQRRLLATQRLQVLDSASTLISVMSSSESPFSFFTSFQSIGFLWAARSHAEAAGATREAAGAAEPPHPEPQPPSSSLPPPLRERSASDVARGLWRPQANGAWVQDMTGDMELYHPPFGARVPGGWVVVHHLQNYDSFVFFSPARHERGLPAFCYQSVPPAEDGGAGEAVEAPCAETRAEFSGGAFPFAATSAPTLAGESLEAATVDPAKATNQWCPPSATIPSLSTSLDFSLRSTAGSHKVDLVAAASAPLQHEALGEADSSRANFPPRPTALMAGSAAATPWAVPAACAADAAEAVALPGAAGAAGAEELVPRSRESPEGCGEAAAAGDRPVGKKARRSRSSRSRSRAKSRGSSAPLQDAVVHVEEEGGVRVLSSTIPTQEAARAAGSRREDGFSVTNPLFRGPAQLPKKPEGNQGACAVV